MTAVFITVYRQRALPKINEERSVQGQINQIIFRCYASKHKQIICRPHIFDSRFSVIFNYVLAIVQCTCIGLFLSFTRVGFVVLLKLNNTIKNGRIIQTSFK